ncbi:MAG: VOC family protein [Alphaproteobacteria bacterium]|nr:VOC family protein [Alphaproteobacteria bacterium]
MSENLIPPHKIRTRFSRAMSLMYREEVPAYGTLLDMVRDVNMSVLENDPELKKKLSESDNLERITEERHGAIRIGKAEELATMSRLFGVMNMKAVSYYDLTQAGVPVHSTCFRPIDGDELSKSPFRVFTSLLRTELITDPELRKKCEAILEIRDIFGDELRYLIDKAEKQGGLDDEDSDTFIVEATHVFKWHEDAVVDKDFYLQLKAIDPRAADIVCFKGPHINHLTPRTLDIDEVQRQMPLHGINPKNVIEGPPQSCPVLLRQTSFKALTEPVKFHGVEGEHTARFGEIEQRSAALRPEGRSLYDEFLNKVRETIIPAIDGSNADEYMQVLEDTFKAFPSTYEEMRKENLAYFQYFLTEKGKNHHGTVTRNINNLIRDGLVDYIPIVYEDFLPVSAAGIFSSNASDHETKDLFKSSSQEEFEKALGHEVLSEFDLYEAIEKNSIAKVLGYFR